MNIYYYQDSERLGPVNAEQLRSLASAGLVKPWTDIEVDGKIYQASKVKGLVFGESTANAAVEADEPPVINNPVINNQDLIVCSDWTKRAFDPIEIQSEKSASQKIADHRRKLKLEAVGSLNAWCDGLMVYSIINIFASVFLFFLVFAVTGGDKITGMTFVRAFAILIYGFIAGVPIWLFNVIVKYIIARDYGR